jgi:hypothetical protein
MQKAAARVSIQIVTAKDHFRQDVAKGALRFYTAKTHSEHQAHCAASTMLGLTGATNKTQSNTFAEIA